MMSEGWVFLGGLLAGILGGFLGLGGGLIMVPFLTLGLGLDIKSVIPLSIAAIAANSIATCNEYLKRDLVDLSLATLLALLSILGFVSGAMLMDLIPRNWLLITFASLILYAIFNILKPQGGKTQTEERPNRTLSPPMMLVTFLVGLLAAMLGIGGGLIMVPFLLAYSQRDISFIRGTWSYAYGFAATAATIIYFTRGQLLIELVAPLVAGILIGGKAGGWLGVRTKSTAVKYLFLILLLYSAFKMGYPALKELL